jgi:hypothetical protein
MRHRRFRGSALGVALLFSYFVMPATMPAHVTGARSRKAAPEFARNDSKGAVVKVIGLQRQSRAAQFLGHMVSRVQDGNALVH